MPKVQSLGLNLNGQTNKYRIIGDIKTLKQDKLNLYKEKELAKLRLLEEKKQQKLTKEIEKLERS